MSVSYCAITLLQFVTIPHGLFHGHVIPLVFALLTNKTVGLYRQLFSHLKRYTRRVTGRCLRPANIVLDFEQAILLAVETELPGTRLSGTSKKTNRCHFSVFNLSIIINIIFSYKIIFLKTVLYEY